MVFVIQHTQNRDARVMHLKLDELIRAVRDARNELVAMEALSDGELEKLQHEFKSVQAEALQQGGQRTE
jgi:low affinity Fe/Cu permease